MLDLLIVGAGLSGLSAALVAARAGLRVRVVAKGLGALHWHAGTLDVLGYLPGDQQAVVHPFTAFESLPSLHPYRRLGQDTVYAALADMVNTLHTAGLTFQGAEGSLVSGPAGSVDERPEQQTNWLLPTAAGAARPTWSAPAGQVAGDLRDERPMLIVGFRGLRDFYPAVIAQHLNQQGMNARATWLPLALITDRRDSATVHLAQALDDPATVDRLAEAIHPLLRTGERVGLPALLGYRRHPATLAQLRAALDAPVFEIPTLPPSVPGIRIHRALVAALAEAGVRVEVGMEAIHTEIEEIEEIVARAESAESPSELRRVRAVETATAARPLRHRAQAFLLATGGILGGGISTDSTGRAWEPIFDLPVAVPPTRGAWFRSEFLDPQGHPIFTGGIEVNDRLQPVASPNGTLVHERLCFANLWAAGNGLAHSDGIRERSLEGVAIATGTAAAQAIVATVRG